MLPCKYCVEAENNPRSGQFTAGCESCWGRSLAAIGAHQDSERTGKMTQQYREVLRTVFGSGRELLGNLEVKAWSSRIKQHEAKI